MTEAIRCETCCKELPSFLVQFPICILQLVDKTLQLLWHPFVSAGVPSIRLHGGGGEEVAAPVQASFEDPHGLLELLEQSDEVETAEEEADLG